ncbi:hypothetical protein AMK16_03805 [Streptomyces sp. CB00455]|uniref:DUF6114 domain-containing protein n=1 Tax=Streptomyces sp. CB00455 TaxID=1703927 RepID=UPI00093A8948|nr:DUF6114 domain-containing protein [Streptomyces sp. CB00455]OKK22294.1 hypothetical protein AMK16_03805 [Streptomyces sp. CB00455]
MLLTRPTGRRPGRFRRWRRSRPFWGGLLALLAGAEICVLPLAPMKVMLQQGVAGIPSVLMGIVMIVLGLTAWFSPPQRNLAGVLTTLIATAALVLSNLGGFLIGTLLGILGGGLMFAWQPYAAPPAGDADPVTPLAGDTVSAAPPAAPSPTPTPHHDPQGAQS